MTPGGGSLGHTVTLDAPDLAAILSQSLQLLAARRGAEALALIARSPASVRADPRVVAQLAYAESLLGRMAEAMAAARAAMAAPALDLVSLDLLGNSFTLCQQPQDAYAAFQRALALAPGNPAVLFNLATTARFLGKGEEAEAAYDRVIAAAPTAWDAYRNRSELRRQTPERNHVADLTRVLERARPPWQGEVQLCYALGKEHEDLAAYDEAFAHFDRGARVRRTHMRYDVADDVEAMRLIEETFDTDWCAPGRATADGDGPIFILGLPRTGSTLLEQMLGRHSSIQPLGELQAFGAAMTGVLRRRTPGLQPGKAAMIRASAALAPHEIGAAYLAAVAPLRDGGPRFIDKLPFNVLYAGLIARALPSARIVHLTRDPLDACVAIYKTLFDEAYPYAYDLAELGAYHNAYRRLTAHWRAALGPRFIEVSYEALVADPSGALTRLMGQLGLSMEPACLDQGRGGAAVMTASASQVREPIHARSVDSAGRYRAHLGPLIEALARYDRSRLRRPSERHAAYDLFKTYVLWTKATAFRRQAVSNFPYRCFLGDVELEDGMSATRTEPLAETAEPMTAEMGARLIPFSSIPVIDISALRSGDRAAMEATAAEIGKACEEVGFFYIKNHGVPEALIARTYELSRRFHYSPFEQRDSVHMRHSPGTRGWVPVSGEDDDGDPELYRLVEPHPEHDYLTKPRLHAAFDLSLELPEDDPDFKAGNLMLVPNQWPAWIPEFREQVMEYYDAVTEVGRQLFDAFALHLDLPEDFFAKLTRKAPSQLRLLHYPPNDLPMDNNNLGIGAHSDFERFTVLHQAGPGFR